MKILIDTTYFLPALSIEIETLPSALLKTLLRDQNYQCHYCEITLFELAAKGVKLSQSDDSLTVNDIIKGLDSIRWDKRLTKLSWYSHPFALELAKEIRKIHTDFIDCLILATAVCYTDMLAMYDETLLKIVRKNKGIIQKILEFNEKFSFWLKDLSKDPIRIDQL